MAYNKGDGAVIMTNSDSGGQLATEILRTRSLTNTHGQIFSQRRTRSVKWMIPKTLARYVGVYRMASGANMVVITDAATIC